VLLTPVRDYSAVSTTLVKHSKTEKASLTSVNDAGEKFLIGYNDANKVCFAGVFDTGDAAK
jgi:hypothetical protein